MAVFGFVPKYLVEIRMRLRHAFAGANPEIVRESSRMA
jgi:hypothetical protein